MTKLLSDDELNNMRSTVQEYALPDVCNLLTPAFAIGSTGAHTATYGTVLTNVACRLDNVSSREVLAGGEVQPFLRYSLTLPYDTALSSNYRVEVGSQTFNVVGMSVNASWPLFLTAILEKVS